MAELCCVCFNLERMFGHQDPYINITASCICPPCKGSIDSNALYPCGGRKMFVNEVLRSEIVSLRIPLEMAPTTESCQCVYTARS